MPQIGAMAKGDHRRKLTLAEYGFRLPSCIDNRPLRFNEWDAMRPQTFAVSATPGSWEMEQTGGVFAEQVIRPTGLIDPPVEIRPVEDQVQDCIAECKATAQKGYRTLVTTLTKRMAEDLTEFMHEQGVRVRYMHSDVETLERIELIRDLRLGVYDVLIGINLLREGLDIPECGLVCILDADKEGFLRSETSLIQTIGRAARNVDSKVILYADRITGSMERAMAETDRRRTRQEEYNAEHGITPTTIRRGIQDIVAHTASQDGVTIGTGDPERNNLVGHNLRGYIQDLEKRMRTAAADLEFEEAGRLRDEIRRLEATNSAFPMATRPRPSSAAATPAARAPARTATARRATSGWAESRRCWQRRPRIYPALSPCHSPPHDRPSACGRRRACHRPSCCRRGSRRCPGQAAEKPAAPAKAYVANRAAKTFTGTFGGRAVRYTATVAERCSRARTARPRRQSSPPPISPSRAIRTARSPSCSTAAPARARSGCRWAHSGPSGSRSRRDARDDGAPPYPILDNPDSLLDVDRPRLHRSGRHRLQPHHRRHQGRRTTGASPRMPSRSRR